MKPTLSTIIGLMFAVQTWSLEIGSRVENFRLLDHQGGSHELYYYDDKKAVVFSFKATVARSLETLCLDTVS